jgi:hypothetical protein
MVDTIESAVDLVTTICRLGGAGDFIQATNALAAERGLVEAVASHDTPALYGWLMESFSFQGISDRIAWSYIEDHGNASWYVVEAGLEATHCQCPKLGSFDAYEAPPGFRALWSDRSRLAMAKLFSKLKSGMVESDFAGVLMEPKGASADCDFIEVHIYGGLHLRLIDRITGPVPTLEEDRHIWKSLKRKLEKRGVSVSEV